MTKQPVRTKYIKIRVTDEESRLIQTGAKNADKPVSQHLRDLSMGTPPVKASLIEQTAADVRNKEIAFELRKIGAMMRGFYPKNDPTWSNEDKKRYWEAMETLLQHAHAIERSKR